jgi:hypothetical protein
VNGDREALELKAEGILAFDKGIRFVVVLRSDGRALAEVGRPGLAPLEPPGESENIYVKAAIAVSMSAGMNRYHGPISAAIVIREKLTIVFFNLSSRMLLISTEPGFPLHRVEELGRLVDQLGLA